MTRSYLPLNSLRAFEAAARHLSFTHAAIELNVTHSAISQHVKTLEQHLNCKLFRCCSSVFTCWLIAECWIASLTIVRRRS